MMLRQTREEIQYFTATSSIFSNAFLIFLITYKSPEQIGNYKYLLICVSLFEMLYGVLDIIANPVTLSFEETFLVVVPHKDRFFGPEVALVLNALYCAFFGFSMGLFVIIFAYRLLVATGKTGILKAFDGFKIISWFLFPLCYGLVWGLAAYFPFAPSKMMDEVIGESVLQKLNLSLNEVAYSGPLFQFQRDEYLIYGIMLALGLQWFLTVSSLFIVGWFGGKCYFHINRLISISSSITPSLKELQTQLFVALVVQALVPVFLMHIPVTMLYSFSLINIEFDSTLITLTISLFPALDPLPTMFIIKSYREAILGYFKNCLKFLRFRR